MNPLEIFSPLERIIHHKAANQALAKVMGLTDRAIEKIGRNKPFDIVHYEQETRKILLPVMQPIIEGLEEWTTHCESIADALIHTELRRELGQGVRADEATLEMKYTVENICPYHHSQSPNRKTIDITREELSQFRRSDYDMTKENNPTCRFCPDDPDGPHDASASFMLYEFPWNNEYESYVQQIVEINETRATTNIKDKLERMRLRTTIPKLEQKIDKLNNKVCAYFIEHRVKGWFSRENKIARILTRFDERRNIQKQISEDKSLCDGSALIIAASTVENAYGIFRNIHKRVGKGNISGIDTFKDYMGTREYDDQGNITIHGPKVVGGKTTFEALKMVVTYFCVPIEVMIMTREFYDTYKEDRLDLTLRMRNEMVKLEKEQGIPIYGIQRIIGNLIRSTHEHNAP